MSGIVFQKTGNLDKIRRFYLDVIGCELWLDQGKCIVLNHGNLLLGFCASDQHEAGGIITFFYPSMEQVDAMYNVMRSTVDGNPRINEQYRIYQFFAKDPEGRTLEFQYFCHPVNGYLTGSELLTTRRSVREFIPDTVPETLLESILNICRYSPTSMNSQSYGFRFINDRDDLLFLAALRGPASAPIAKAPMAVAIFADPSKTKRSDQDADIAAYHFILAAHHLGLGTCWIAAMNRDDVKKHLEIPMDFHIATITPLGFPRTINTVLPERNRIKTYYR